ncbi:hypothetical protein [Nocardia sp. CDC160]|uniref:hypothetical protein n=1 Tax=Nocardia sp. CDC160 TaxID=3112166 RepID=UPI002DBD4782|nr:hypothetical protein [Nocardia sp. CDC160]MEC3915615.1 hypothetical protein [Nocardia sp. CDC160]
MVSARHEAMHRIFQHDPAMFARAFRALALPFPDPTEVTVLTTDLTEHRPLERRVDTLLRIATGQGEFLLIVEAQGHSDAGKPSAWTYYIAHLSAKYDLPVILLVVCHDRATARWASSLPDVGLPFWPSLTTRPLVLGPHNVPVVTDVDTAAADIPLAALSAATHATDPQIGAILKALSTALKTLEKEDARWVFAEYTELSLGSTPAADQWRKLMTVELSFFRSETAQRLRAEGREEGRAAAEAETLSDTILFILEQRGIPVGDEDRTRITSCADREQLLRWRARSLEATSTTELFGDSR